MIGAWYESSFGLKRPFCRSFVGGRSSRLPVRTTRSNPVAEAEAALHAAPQAGKNLHGHRPDRPDLERRFAGRIAAVQTVDLSFQVPGRLVQLPVLESQQVKEGDLVASLDTTDYDRAVAGSDLPGGTGQTRIGPAGDAAATGR